MASTFLIYLRLIQVHFFLYFVVKTKKIFKNFVVFSFFKETELGKIFARSGWKRSSFVITTKIYWSTKSEERGLSRKHIIESVKASLQRLQLSYIDIVIIYKADSMCPMEGNEIEFIFFSFPTQGYLYKHNLFFLSYSPNHLISFSIHV